MNYDKLLKLLILWTEDIIKYEFQFYLPIKGTYHWPSENL